MSYKDLPHSVRPEAEPSRPWGRGVLQAVSRWRRERRNRARLAALDDDQLRDAGIDLTAAGRGKAVAVDRIAAATLSGMGHLR